MSEWVRYRIRTIPEAEDVIIGELTELGLSGAQIEDNVPLTAAEKEQIYTYDADDPVNDGIAYVSFYTELKDDGSVTLNGDREDEAGVTPDALRARMEEALSAVREHMEIGDGTLDVSLMDDADWKDNWKQFFHRFYVDDILITPSWEAEDTARGVADSRSPAYTLMIDPGCAFGTGAHETTQLAIRAVRKTIEAHPEASVLDIGTGSGILAILALMFGAKKAVGVDVDAFTEEAVKQNLASNGTDPARFEMRIGNLLEDRALREELKALSPEGEGYEIVIANILPVVLAPLTPLVPQLLRAGGVYITSGILCEKEETMRGILENEGFRIKEVTRQGEWCAIVSVKEGD